MRLIAAAALLALTASSCESGIRERGASDPSPRFKGPSESIQAAAGGTAFEPPAPGLYRYSSAYHETGSDHTHNETLRISQVDGADVRTTRAWWRQDREVPWFETLVHADDATRLTSFTLTEARERPCLLDPPLVWIPSTVGVGSTWKGSSVCKNDSGFKRYVDIEMRATAETQVSVGGQSIPAVKLEGRLAITRSSSQYTMGIERQISLRHGLVLTETWKFSDPHRGSGRLERTIVALPPA